MTTPAAMPPAHEPDPAPDLPPPHFETCVLIVAFANDYIELLEKIARLILGS